MAERKKLVQPLKISYTEPSGEIELEEPFEEFEEGAVPFSKRFKEDSVPQVIEIADPFESDHSEPSSTAFSTSSDSESSKHSDDVDNVDLEDPFQDFDFNVYGDALLDFDDSGPLHESCKFSVVQTLAMMFSWFCSYSISKEAFGRLMHILHHFMLPANNNLPSSYESARNIIKGFLVPVKEFDCCINDCMIFRNSSEGNFENLTECPKCNSTHYHLHTKIAQKKFKYIPLAPRLKRMFANSKVSELLQKHGERCLEDNYFSDLHESHAWKSLYATDGPYRGDPRGISLSLCTDGTNPFSKENISYSMWPFTLAVLNFPLKLRNRSGSMLLAGIIPGKSEPINMNPYVSVLVDEILTLNNIECYDAYKKELFQLRVDILLHILDYPGQNKLFDCVGAGGYAACAYCTHKGTYSNVLQKMVYPGNRCYLKEDDSLHSDLHCFPDKKPERSMPPSMKTSKYIDEANAAFAVATTNGEKKRKLVVKGLLHYDNFLFISEF